MYFVQRVKPCLHVTFFFKNDSLYLSIMSINNGQNLWSAIPSVIQPVTIDTLLNNNGLFYYRPQRSCEGYVFTPVCQSFYSRRGSASVHAGIPPPPQEAPHPPWEAPPGKHTPPGSTPPRRHPPEAPPRRQLTLRMVGILLECILVKKNVTCSQDHKTILTWMTIRSILF